MRETVFAFLSVVVLVSACGRQSAVNAGVAFDPRDTVKVPEGLTGEDSIAYVEDATVKSPINAADLLGLAETHSVEDMLVYWYDVERARMNLENVDSYLATHRDSAAMCFANRFMRMGDLVKLNGDANDKLQWAVAVNAARDAFHEAVPSVPVDSIIDEIGKVVYKFSSQTQYEMNFMCYVDAMVDYYRTIESYRQWLSTVPAELKPLVREEYAAWHNLNEARFAFWQDVSYRQEWYSMKPMEIAGYYEKLSANRRAELDIERSIILDGKPYQQKGKTVTSVQWEKWIADHSVPEDAEFFRDMERDDMMPDESTVENRVNALKTTFSQWQAARKSIVAALPKQQGVSYDNLTADMHSRMVGKLADIIPFDEW